MTIARKGLKVRVIRQANVVGLTLIEGSFFLVYLMFEVVTSCTASMGKLVVTQATRA